MAQGWVELQGHELALEPGGNLLRIVPTAFATDTESAYRGITAKIFIKVGSFQGNLTSIMYLGELQAFAKSLASLCASIEGTAEFISGEYPFRFAFLGMPTGAVKVTGEIWDSLASNSLRVTFSIDQTYLPPLLQSVVRLIKDCS